MNQALEQKEQKAEPHYLWWEDRENQSNLAAGVAFWDDEFGEFRLKIDIFPGQNYYLRTVGSANGRPIYRAEVAVKKNGRFVARRAVGEGKILDQYPEQIFINFGPFSKRLVMVL